MDHQLKKMSKVKKAKSGGSFPDLNKDGKVTKADILKGRGVIAKKGANVKKAENGDQLRKGQYKRIGRIAEKNPERAERVAGRMNDRASRVDRGKDIASPRENLMMKMNNAVKERENKYKELGKTMKESGARPAQPKLVPALTIERRVDSGPTKPKQKMKNGGMLSAPKKDGLSMQLGTYKNVIGKNTKGKATKAVGLTKAKYGKTMMKGGGKCKNGC